MPSPFDPALSRRQFLGGTGMSLGGVALANLMASSPLKGAEVASAARGPHFAPRAKRVIWLFMHGGPSHVDLLDPKPDLVRYAGKSLPESFGNFETRRKVAQNPLLGPVKPFRPRGQSGIEISDFLPHMAALADELCLIRSCHGDSVNHPQSVYQMNTGSILMGRPSLGSWVSYGLGSENEDMPAFVVMPDPGGGLKGGPPAWGNGYLPATYQGTTMRPGEQPILDLKPAGAMTSQRQRSTLDLVRQMNELHAGERERDTQLLARLEAYELAYRMQSAAPEAVDISRETEATRELYGLDHPVTRDFGTRCLLARRMIERGVRFVQLYSGDTNGWDAHEDVLKNHTLHCERTDKPVAGLLRDLKQRGLLEDTLVVWGGEFGRMPMSEKGTGRDHNPYGYTTVLAGAGVKSGHVHGATDELGLRAERDKVHVHDLHATILHLLGVDHERLTYRHHGRDDRLTDVAGHVVKGILA
jgi:hypothetical protein